MASIFREQNLERVSNPDTPNDYVRIPHARIWMLVVVALLLAGAAVVWGLFGAVELKAKGWLVVGRGASTLWLPEDKAQTLVPGSSIEAGGASGIITSPAGEPEAMENIVAEGGGGNETLAVLGSWLCPFSVSIILPEGSYPASVVLQRFTPWELLFGGAQADAEV